MAIAAPPAVDEEDEEKEWRYEVWDHKRGQKCGEFKSALSEKETLVRKDVKTVRDQCKVERKATRETMTQCQERIREEQSTANRWIQKHADCCDSPSEFKGFGKPRERNGMLMVPVRCERF